MWGGGGGGKSGLLSGGVSTNESDYELVENSIAEVGCIVNMENKLWQINPKPYGIEARRHYFNTLDPKLYGLEVHRHYINKLDPKPDGLRYVGTI